MVDPEVVFGALALKPGDRFLDLGCGAGDYSLYAAGLVGRSGKVYALDLWEALLDSLNQEAALKCLANIETRICDISNNLDFKDGSIDVCFLSAVVHTLDLNKTGERFFGEIRRVLRGGGKLSVIECKKEQSAFGPPLAVRLSAEDLEGHITRCGFEKRDYIDLGYNYLIQFIAV
jgi:ubiquinone/menaquinone biosynthesis C-methylase UbiE